MVASAGSLFSLQEQDPAVKFTLTPSNKIRVIPENAAISIKLWPDLSMKPSGLSAGPKQQDGKKNERESRVNLGRATLEYFTVLLYSWPNHLRTYDGRLEEWEFGWNWDDQLRRTFTLDGWRFDSNSFFMNYGHVLAGASYYNIARSNNMNVFQSFLFNTAGSLFWEYIPEWRQVISINDVVYNVFGALSMGEALFQVSKYFMNKKGFIYRLLEFTNPLTKMNKWLDGKTIEPWQKTSPASSGFFDIFFGQRYLNALDNGDIGKTFWIGIETRLRSFPDINRKEFSGPDPSINFTEVRWNMSTDKDGKAEANFRALVQLFSLVNQKIDKNNRGHSFSFGLASAFTYYRRRPVAFYDSHKVRPRHGVDLHLEEPRNFTDKYTAVHMLGPRIEYTAYRGDLSFRISTSVFLDFSFVNALALNTYSADNDISLTKTSMLYFGFYYAYGATLNTNLTLSYKNLMLEGRLWAHAWDSIEGRDRFQDEILDDFDIDDQRLRWTMDIKYVFSRLPFGLLLRYEVNHRSGVIKEVRETDTISRWAGGLVVRF